MNDEFHTYLKKAGDELTLSHEERERMRGVLQSYMEMKPLRETALSSRETWGGVRFFSPRSLTAVLVLAIFITSGGISYAAQNALPGDALYSFKVHINEPVAGALALTSSAKAEWAMDVAGERLKEAATLAAEGRLSTTTQADLQANFESHAALAIQTINAEAVTSADTGAQSAVQFEAQLSEYERVLSTVAAGDTASSTLSFAIRAQLSALSGVRAQTRSEAASAPDTAIAASRMRSAAKGQLEDSLNLARRAASALSSSSADVVAQALVNASTSIEDGDALLGKHSVPEALGVFQNALTATERLGVFLQTSSAIHERTGRVITEPRQDPNASSAQRAQRSSEKSTGSGSAVLPSPEDGTSGAGVSATVNATTGAQTDAHGTGAPAAGVTTGGDAGTHVEVQGSNDGEGADDSPISIPVPSSLLH